MTIRELFDLFMDFKKNEFGHLQNRVDRIFILIITALVGIVGTLLAVILK